MKKIWKICTCSLMAMMLAAGCSKQTDNTVSTAVVDTTGAETSTESKAESEAQTTAQGSQEDQVELGEYKGIAYTPASTEVSDEEVNAEMQALADANPIINEVDRAAAEGDVVNIDYVGMKDGVAFDGGTASGFDLTLGSGDFIAGFEEGLIGTVKGQEVSLNLTFPEEYFNKDVAGQEVVFDVTVNAVKESVPVELDDHFVAKYTDYKTVEEFRRATRENLEQYAADSAEEQKKSDVFQKVMENAKVTVSEETIQKYFDEQWKVYEEQAAAFGIDMEKLAGFYYMDLEAFKEQIKEVAGAAAKQNAVLKAIAEAEKITIQEEDREKAAEDFGYESVEAMVESAGQDAVDNYIISEKVIEFLADQAVEK